MIRNRLLNVVFAAALLGAAACGSDHQATGSDASSGPDVRIPGEGKPVIPPVDGKPTAPGMPGMGEEPTDPGSGEEPTDPGSGEEPTDPGSGEEPTDPGTGEEPTEPGSGEEPTEPGSGEEPTEPGTAQPNVDRFGVTMIYPTVENGETWFLSDDPESDPRFDPQQSIKRNSDGSWKMRSNKVRMHVKTSTGYNNSKIATYDREELARKGYMQAPNDWKNVEMTGYVKVNDTPDDSDNFAWYARGGRHSDGIACEGSAYKGSLHFDGRTRFQKESWHVSYDQSSYSKTTSSIVGRWVGFKTVMRNIERDGRPAVHLELWLADDGSKTNWEKVYEMVDDGSWGGDSGECGASDPAMPLIWGGPLATFRWDTATDVDFKWLSVREIEPIR